MISFFKKTYLSYVGQKLNIRTKTFNQKAVKSYKNPNFEAWIMDLKIVLAESKNMFKRVDKLIRTRFLWAP